MTVDDAVFEAISVGPPTAAADISSLMSTAVHAVVERNHNVVATRNFLEMSTWATEIQPSKGQRGGEHKKEESNKRHLLGTHARQ